jgi:hypothetical protein
MISERPGLSQLRIVAIAAWPALPIGGVPSIGAVSEGTIAVPEVIIPRLLARYAVSEATARFGVAFFQGVVSFSSYREILKFLFGQSSARHGIMYDSSFVLIAGKHPSRGI